MKLRSLKGHLKTTTALVTILGILGFQGAMGGLSDGASEPEVVATRGGNQAVPSATTVNKLSVDNPFRERGEPRSIMMSGLAYGIMNNDKPWFDIGIIDPQLINHPDSTGRTPLMWALLKGRDIFFDRLLADGADITPADMNGDTVLTIAALTGQEDIVTRFLDINSTPAYINHQNKISATALTLASLGKEPSHENIVYMLLKNGADFSLRMSGGKSAMDVAKQQKRSNTVTMLTPYPQEDFLRLCRLGDFTNIKMIFDQRKDWSIQVNGRDELKGLPLIFAELSKNDELVAFLKEKGATKEVEEELMAFASLGDICRVKELVFAGVDLGYESETGFSPLLLAIINKQEIVARYLVNNGAPLLTRRGVPALCLAAQKNMPYFIEFLLQKGVNINETVSNSTKDHGTTALFYAAQDGFSEVVALLLNQGADVNLARQDETTPLAIAVENNHWQIADQLIKARTQVDRVNSSGTTPLNIASYNGAVESVKLLIQAGADVNSKDKQGLTPLFGASQQGHVAIVSELLKHPNLKYQESMLGETTSPLMAAAGQGHEDVVKLLIPGRTTEDIQNAHGVARSNAPESVRARILSLLLEPLVLETVQEGNLYRLTNLCVIQETSSSNKRVGKDKKSMSVTFSIDPVIGREALLLALKLGKQVMVNFLVSDVKVQVGILGDPQQHSVKDHKGKLSPKPMAQQKGETLLMVAAQQGNLPAVRYLCQVGSIDARDELGKTALMRAAQEGHVHVAEELITHKTGDLGEDIPAADPTLFDDQGFTALHLAVQAGHTSVVDALIHPQSPGTQDKGKKPAKASGSKNKSKAGVSIDIRSKNGKTPFVLAMETNNVPMMTHLMKWGATLETSHGSTMLHLAAEKGWKAVYDHLLSTHKLDPNARNEDGKTAQDILNDRVWDIRAKIVEAQLPEGSSLLCPIGHSLMRDPVRIEGQRDQFVFEKQKIERHFKTKDTNPLTNETLKDKTLIPVEDIKQQIETQMTNLSPYTPGMEWSNAGSK